MVRLAVPRYLKMLLDLKYIKTHQLDKLDLMFLHQKPTGTLNLAKRPTIADLARETGLGVATIDRALNGRSHVSARTIQRVALAAEKLGYYAAGHATSPIARDNPPELVLGFVLHKPAHAFYQRFADNLREACAARGDYRIQVEIQFPQSQSETDCIKAIEQVAQKAQAIAVVAPNMPEVLDALERIHTGGTPVFTLLNDIREHLRDGYYGTDNLKAGRVAAWMLTTQIKHPGKLAVFVGHSRWHSHMMREAGFQAYLRQFEPDFELLAPLVNLDTRQTCYEATLAVLQREPDLRGIYVAGGGMEGAIKALRAMRPAKKVALVVHELTTVSRKALLDRYVSLVLDTPLPEICAAVVSAQIDAINGGSVGPRTSFSPQLFGPESV